MTARIAIVDAGSFILPYDFQLVKALAGRGEGVDFYGSTTRYNAAFLDAMRHLPGVVVHARSISSSVASRIRGAWAYLGLLATLLWNTRRYAIVNLQFSGFWPAHRLETSVLEGGGTGGFRDCDIQRCHRHRVTNASPEAAVEIDRSEHAA